MPEMHDASLCATHSCFDIVMAFNKALAASVFAAVVFALIFLAGPQTGDFLS